MAKSILITGSKGTVGRGLMKEFYNRGHRIIGCDLYHSHDEAGFSLRTDVKGWAKNRMSF